MIYFILGVLFIELGLPIIEAVSVVIVTGLEVLKGRLNLTISKYNVQIQKLGAELDKSDSSHPIGFILPTIDEEEEEEDDE